MTLRLGLATLALAFLLIGGCPADNGLFIIDDFITVRVINATNLEIDPAVEVGRFSGVLSFLNFGVVLPGEVVEIDVRCDDAFFLTTTNSTQFGLLTDYVLDPLPFFELDRDYFCGELVEFEFQGDGFDFDVFVFAGGENIY